MKFRAPTVFAPISSRESKLVLLFGVFVRLIYAFRFPVGAGYDAHYHMAYTAVIASGHLPRVTDLVPPHVIPVSQHPPLYYVLAFLLGCLGLDEVSGRVIAFAAGIVRMLLADKIFREELHLSDRARLFANIIQALIPFAVRIDLYYSNESLATTLSLVAVFLAIRRRFVWSGVALGAALLTKSTTVAAIPAVAIAALISDGMLRFDRAAFKRLAIAGGISLALLLPWAYPNLVEHRTPYPAVDNRTIAKRYTTPPDIDFEAPVWARHSALWYRPWISEGELLWPYFDLHGFFPGFHAEAWGDYYNRFRQGRPTDALMANGIAISHEQADTHIVFAHVGLLFLAAWLAGFVVFVRRVRRREASPGEIAIATLGISALLIAFIWAVLIPVDDWGSIKATYALSSVVILSGWAGRGLAMIERPPFLRYASAIVAFTPVAITIWQLLVF